MSDIGCPWCASTKAPIPTAEHLGEAVFQYGHPGDSKHVARNPLMCPDCLGVGGWEDWGYFQFASEPSLRFERQTKFGVLLRHTSTVAENVEITVERGCHGPYYIRVRRCVVITHEESWETEVRARTRFERVVELHERGESIDA